MKRHHPNITKNWRKSFFNGHRISFSGMAISTCLQESRLLSFRNYVAPCSNSLRQWLFALTARANFSRGVVRESRETKLSVRPVYIVRFTLSAPFQKRVRRERERERERDISVSEISKTAKILPTLSTSISGGGRVKISQRCCQQAGWLARTLYANRDASISNELLWKAEADRSLFRPKNRRSPEGSGKREREKERKRRRERVRVANKALPLRLTLNAPLTSQAGKLFRKWGRFTRPAAASEL